jgi:hypothetical protein
MAKAKPAARNKPTAKPESAANVKPRPALREHPTLRELSKICLALDGEGIDWSEVRNLVELSYGLAAPKRLRNRR